MKRLPYLLLLCIILLGLNLVNARAAPEADLQRQASEVFALINNYRAANGIPALNSNSILYQSAQAQSDYQASIGQITHGGSGGTRPIDRAYAAGYGDGQIIFISELITGGTQQDPSGALNWWQNSTEHNFYLLHADYVDLGIGVANDANGWFYYTAVLGHFASGTTYVPASPEEAAAVEAQPLIIPVTRDERRENGAIVHIVRTGQSLWNISAVYEVPLETIYELNKLNANSLIFPGDEIILKLPDESTQPDETSTEAETSPAPSRESTTEELIATPSPMPSNTPVDSPNIASATAVASPDVSSAEDKEGGGIQFGIFIALGSIVLVVMAIFFVGSRQSLPTEGKDWE